MLHSVHKGIGATLSVHKGIGATLSVLREIGAALCPPGDRCCNLSTRV